MADARQPPATAQLEYWEERIRERPLTALGVAALAGFVLGGALRTRTGWALLAFAGRMAVKEAATNYFQGLIAEDGFARPSRTAAPSTSAAAFD
jgi:hypothetical protein